MVEGDAKQAFEAYPKQPTLEPNDVQLLLHHNVGGVDGGAAAVGARVGPEVVFQESLFRRRGEECRRVIAIRATCESAPLSPGRWAEACLHRDHRTNG